MYFAQFHFLFDVLKKHTKCTYALSYKKEDKAEGAEMYTECVYFLVKG